MTTEYKNPPDECDLVMKGGITSGIVYPPAVLKLATRYRFRCIGGTSAGAIAAAVTAAAEYGRESGGFEKLREVSDKLGKGTFLRDLFQPSKKTAPLMNTLFAIKESATGHKGWQAAARVFLGLNLALLREATLPFIFGAAAGIAVSLLLAWLTGGSLRGRGLILPLILAWAGGLVGSALSLAVVVLKHIPQNLFGLCTGRKDRLAPEDSAVLTDWLSESINLISGKSPGDGPLTFGDLKKKNIHVKMMTSNLSQNLPYELPFGRRRFIFNKNEFEKLFPDDVVNHLTARAHRSERVTLPDGYYFLPEPDDLPVAVAMRMSLSFPVLISAVPLYTISLDAFRQRRGRSALPFNETDLQRNWFSDGGIASNFPIHFFDAWLPTRPTFGITLVSLPPDAFTKEGEMKQSDPKYMSVLPDGGTEGGEQELSEAGVPEKVFLPKANRPQNPDWKPIPDLFGFLWSIFATAQNYRDITQAMLPSYRERVAQIRLSDTEGGANLAMSEETIKNVKEKGDLAGELLLKDFNFDHHQWVRFRVLMGLLESNLKDMETVLKRKAFHLDRLKDLQLNEQFPYPRNRAWCDEALKRIVELEELVRGWQRLPLFGEAPPLPKPVLRVVPEV